MTGMKTIIRDTRYKGIDAVSLENEKLSVLVIPKSGGKIQSIYDKIQGREYLFQSNKPVYALSKYDSPYGMGDASGFDEVFPSIEACFYPHAPWKGTAIPDHGEVWALPWNCVQEGEMLALDVYGVRFPYRLSKRIQLTDRGGVLIQYEAVNQSPFDFRFIWAPHLLLTCDPDTEIVLPPSVRQVMSTCSVDNKLGRFGTVHSWPLTNVKGEPYRIDRVYPKYPGKCEKYYAVDQLAEGWCALRNRSTGHAIGVRFPLQAVPYLGIWEGIVNEEYVTALEPCTGSLDDLSTAVQWDRAGLLSAHSRHRWYLELRFGDYDHLELETTEDCE